ncbi:MAG: ABC transporter substrate-binding protein, partial [Actinomycetota bacterium]|nr:ABC transporter substrate-binding protein [Actinomycetota bacterium]
MPAGSWRSWGRRPGACLLAVLVTLALVASAAAASRGSSQDRRERDPTGVVRVAYPEEPASWYPVGREQPASIDLAALWGLPLYRVDSYGQLRPALAESSEVHPGSEGAPWEVDVRLRQGSWSDGRPVVSADVVATLEAVRSVRPSHLEALVAATEVDERTVRLTFSRPYGRWPYLLAGGISVLPAHVLAVSGLEAYSKGVPVAGGPFRLERHDPGLRAIFLAHPDGPTGAPALHRVDVYFTPSYETALGLLGAHKIDVGLGYLALNPLERARRVEGVDSAAPLGGTWTSLHWRPGGRLASSPQRRTGARDAVSVAELVEGLLGRAGEVMTSTIPGIEGPWHRLPGPTVRLGRLDVEVLVPAYQEALHFTARALLLDLAGGGIDVQLVRIEPDELAERAAGEADGSLLVRRDLPRPSLVDRAPADAPAELLALLAAADDAGSAEAPVLGFAFERLREHASELPLYRMGVAHVWRRPLQGFRASAWPG